MGGGRALTIQAGLGAAVDGHGRQRRQARGRADVDDDAELAGAHVGHGGAGEAEGREQQGLELAVHLVVGEVLGGAVDGEAGVVDEHVDLDALALELPDQGPAVRVVDVERLPAAALGAVELGHELRRLGGVARGGDDPVALRPHDARQGQAEARRAARDEPGQRPGRDGVGGRGVHEGLHLVGVRWGGMNGQ